jgi:hypothetical protein
MLRARRGVQPKVMESIPSRFVVDDERKDNPGGGVNGERALLDDEVRNGKQWDWGKDGKNERPTGTKCHSTQPFRR